MGGDANRAPTELITRRKRQATTDSFVKPYVRKRGFKKHDDKVISRRDIYKRVPPLPQPAVRQGAQIQGVHK